MIFCQPCADQLTPIVGPIYICHEFLNMPKQTCERCGAQNVPCIGSGEYPGRLRAGMFRQSLNP